MRAAVGQPLVLGQHSLGNQAPPPNSFGAPVPIAQRVRDRLGFQQQAAPTQGPYMQAPRMPAPPQPSYQNPSGLTPPGRIPSARTGADPTITGSVAKPAKKEDGPAGLPEANLLSPRPIAEETPQREAASVFDLLKSAD